MSKVSKCKGSISILWSIDTQKLHELNASPKVTCHIGGWASCIICFLTPQTHLFTIYTVFRKIKAEKVKSHGWQNNLVKKGITEDFCWKCLKEITQMLHTALKISSQRVISYALDGQNDTGGEKRPAELNLGGVISILERRKMTFTLSHMPST